MISYQSAGTQAPSIGRRQFAAAGYRVLARIANSFRPVAAPYAGVRVIGAIVSISFLFGSQLPGPSGNMASADPPETAGLEKPGITATKVVDDMMGRAVQPAASTKALPQKAWIFQQGDFRRVRILDIQAADNKSTVDVFVTTDNNPRFGQADFHVVGTLRLHYEWSQNEWNLGQIENLTFSYAFGPAG